MSAVPAADGLSERYRNDLDALARTYGDAGICRHQHWFALGVATTAGIILAQDALLSGDASVTGWRARLEDLDGALHHTSSGRSAAEAVAGVDALIRAAATSADRTGRGGHR